MPLHPPLSAPRPPPPPPTASRADKGQNLASSAPRNELDGIQPSPQRMSRAIWKWDKKQLVSAPCQSWKNESGWLQSSGSSQVSAQASRIWGALFRVSFSRSKRGLEGFLMDAQPHDGSLAACQRALLEEGQARKQMLVAEREEKKKRRGSNNIEGQICKKGTERVGRKAATQK